MNKLKKIYCRIFQWAFRAAKPVLPYREPKVLKSTDEIAFEIKKMNKEAVLIVTDEFLRNSGATADLEQSLTASKIRFFVYDRTRPNPTVENVEAALLMYKSNGCQAIVAFGGGSAMDCAKAVGARVVYPKRSINQLKGNLRVFRKLPPLFAVPTTAGTGSEVTVTAVITDSKKKRKYTMNSFPFIPNFAVLDPRVTFSLPKNLTATTGMDALTHAVESYIGRSTSKETRALAKESVKLIFDNIETAYYEPKNYIARENMLIAAYKAGIAFSKSYVGYNHAIAHSLGGEYNIAHGLANSVLLPIILKGYGETIHKKLYKLAIFSGVADENDSICVGAKKFIAKIESLNENMEIPKKLIGIRAEDIPVLAKHADEEANPLYPVPVLMNAKELEKYYLDVM